MIISYIQILYLTLFKFTEGKKSDNEEYEPSLETVIKIEEPDLEKVTQPSAINTSNNAIKQDDVDKNEPDIINIVHKTTENCDITKIDDMDDRKADISSNASDEPSPNIEYNNDKDRNQSSTTDIIKIPRNAVHRTMTPDIDEPAAKKRRLAASEFLEDSDSNSIDLNIESNKHATKIPQTISGDIKTYLGDIQGPCSNDKATESCFDSVRKTTFY